MRNSLLISCLCTLLFAAARAEQPLPSAPTPQLAAAPPPAQPAGDALSLDQAEALALRNNPEISVAHLLALAQAQVTREARSAEMPSVRADLTAANARENTRITAGALNNPTVFERAAGGLTVSQLITDFGRTRSLIKSAQSTAQAQLDSSKATELDIRLAVDQAFYRALTTQAIFKVAEQTVAERQSTADQVSALTQSKVRSELDLSFANVQLSEAKLMLLDAQNDEQSAMAALNAVLGSEQDRNYALIDPAGGDPQPAPTDADALIAAAFQQRPDLASLNDRSLAARQFSTAQRDLMLPTISALGSGGGTPVRSSQILSAAGINIDIPLFNGFLFTAEAREARLRSQAEQEQVRVMRNAIARDVRTAVLNAQAAYQRIGVTQSMLDAANLALDLAQARYKLGLSSIVELTQAQLAQTQARIENTTARYSYQTASAELRYETGQ